MNIGSKNKKEKKQLSVSTLITAGILIMLILIGTANAVSILISGLMSSYTQDSIVKFNVTINISDPDRYVPARNISVNLTGPLNISRIFDMHGRPLSGDQVINITPFSTPLPGQYGYGYGYGVDNGYGYNFGYGYGYGNGVDAIDYAYKVSINTTTLPVGNYSLKAMLNTGEAIKPAFVSQIFKFEIIPTIQIMTETFNPGSNQAIEVAVLSSAGFNSSAEINKSTIRFGPSGAVPFFIKENQKDVNGDGYLDLIVKFHARDTGIECGMTSANLTAKTHDGLSIDGSDTFETNGCR